MDAPLFLRIASRLAVYDGALTAAFRRLVEKHDRAATAASPAPAQGAPAPSRAPTQAAGARGGELHHGIRIPKGAEVVSFAEMVAANPDLIGFQKVG